MSCPRIWVLIFLCTNKIQLSYGDISSLTSGRVTLFSEQPFHFHIRTLVSLSLKRLRKHSRRHVRKSRLAAVRWVGDPPHPYSLTDRTLRQARSGRATRRCREATTTLLQEAVQSSTLPPPRPRPAPAPPPPRPLQRSSHAHWALLASARRRVDDLSRGVAWRGAGAARNGTFTARIARVDISGRVQLATASSRQ